MALRWERAPLAAFALSVVLVAAAACSSFGEEAEAGASDAGGDAATPTTGDGDDAGDAALGAYGAAILADRPIAYFRLDDEPPAAGEGALFDEVSRKRLGYVHGAPRFGDQGHVGAALALDGDAFIELPKYTFAGTSPFSLELWVKPTSAGFKHILTDQQRGGPKQGWALLQRTDGFAFERFVADASKITSATPFPMGELTHVAVTYDGMILRLYVGGVFKVSVDDNRSLAQHETPCVLGAAAIDGELKFTGTLDELAIYDRALSAMTVAAHARAR